MKAELAETLTAAAACFRVIARNGLADEALAEMKEAGVTENFGVRAQQALGKKMPLDPKLWRRGDEAQTNHP